MRRTKASLINRRTKNLRAVQLLLGHAKVESTVRHLDLEVDHALAMAEDTEACLGSKGSKATVRRLSRTDDSDTLDVEVSGRFQLNHVGLMRRLAMLDLGLVVLADALAADDVAAGRLRRVLPDWQGPRVPVYAITETRLLPAKTQRFTEFLRDRLGQS